jgi:hypothetical protein
MPTPIINGTNGPILQRTRISYDPAQGPTTTEEWESAGDNLGGVATRKQNLGIAYDWTRSGVRSRLVATQSRNHYLEEQSVERWELMSNQDMHDIKQAPKSVALGQVAVAEVLKAIRNHENGRTVDTTAWSANKLALFEHMRRGITTYPVYKWVLRYTATVSNSYLASTTANAGLGTIYTTPEAADAVPAGRLRNTINSISEPDADSYTTWGWLKASYTEVQTANNRIDISAEYLLDAWSNYIHLA